MTTTPDSDAKAIELPETVWVVADWRELYACKTEGAARVLADPGDAIASYAPASSLEALRAELATEREGRRHLETGCQLLRSVVLAPQECGRPDIERWFTADRDQSPTPAEAPKLPTSEGAGRVTHDKARGVVGACLAQLPSWRRDLLLYIDQQQADGNALNYWSTRSRELEASTKARLEQSSREHQAERERLEGEVAGLQMRMARALGMVHEADGHNDAPATWEQLVDGAAETLKRVNWSLEHQADLEQERDNCRSQRDALRAEVAGLREELERERRARAAEYSFDDDMAQEPAKPAQQADQKPVQADDYGYCGACCKLSCACRPANPAGERGGFRVGAALKSWRPDSRFTVRFEWDLSPDRSTKHDDGTGETLEAALADLFSQQGFTGAERARMLAADPAQPQPQGDGVTRAETVSEPTRWLKSFDEHLRSKRPDEPGRDDAVDNALWCLLGYLKDLETRLARGDNQ